MGYYALIIFHMIFSSIQLNLSNLTTDGIIKAAFNPYYSVFGEFTWGIILGFIGAAIYANERSIGTVSTYLILVGLFVSIIFPTHIVAVFGVILSFLIAVIFYKAFVERQG